MSAESKSKRILVAPLDWGLGHATRCIPLIRVLLQLGCEVLIGAEGKHAALLKQEFPGLAILPLQGYRVEYADKGKDFGMKMVRQLPQLRRSIRRENRWLKEMVAKHKIDAIISDNRLGLFHKKIPAVILTHQLLIKSPFPVLDRCLQWVNYYFINKFRQCWVPDFEGPDNLAGALSHPAQKPAHTAYIGAISRFERQTETEKKYDLLVLISGPEPQRSRFEEMALSQLPALSLRVLIVSGQPSESYDRQLSEHVRQVSHLDAATLNNAFNESELVISRAGYTTVMDLIKLNKKAILIPTPGQTEQEYLAKLLRQRDYFYTTSQEALNLKTVLEACRSFPFRMPPPKLDMEAFKPVLAAFVASL